MHKDTDVKNPTSYERILDLVLSSESGLVDDVVVGCPVGNSDHNKIRSTIPVIKIEQLTNGKYLIIIKPIKRKYVINIYYCQNNDHRLRLRL